MLDFPSNATQVVVALSCAGPAGVQDRNQHPHTSPSGKVSKVEEQHIVTLPRDRWTDVKVRAVRVLGDRPIRVSS